MVYALRSFFWILRSLCRRSLLLRTAITGHRLQAFALRAYFLQQRDLSFTLRPLSGYPDPSLCVVDRRPERTRYRVDGILSPVLDRSH